jgi:hypothetical protein
MILAAALATVAVSLAGPAPATLNGDLEAAAAYWHQNTPVRCSTEAVSYTELPHRVLGEATIPDPAQSGPCVMDIEPGLSRRLRCLTVVHEFGHWLGFHHSKNRRSPMFPIIGQGAIVPQCERP